MVLDPLSALVVASTVISFVDFAGKIVSKTNALHNCTGTFVVEQRQMIAVTERLSDLSISLQHAEAKASRYKDQDLTKSELALRDVAKECQKISEDFKVEMEELMPIASQSHWKSFRQAFKAQWKKEGLDKIQKRLTVQREQLIIHLLVWMK